MEINNKYDLTLFLIKNNFLIVEKKGKYHIFRKDKFAFIIKEVKL